MNFYGESLKDARAWMQRQLEGKGAVCPCCDRYGKVYERKMTASMGQALVTMYRTDKTRYHHIPSLFQEQKTVRANDGALLRHWGLIESDGEAGWWRLTEHGRNFAEGIVRVPARAILYGGRFFGTTGDMVYLHHVLGEFFDYGELMSTESKTAVLA